MSSRHDVISSVLQGTALGPLLFLIYTNDMPRIITLCTSSFADDTNIYGKPIKNANDLQEDYLARKVVDRLDINIESRKVYGVFISNEM